MLNYFLFEYYEAGNAFRGYITAKWLDGEVVADSKSWDMTETGFDDFGLL